MKTSNLIKMAKSTKTSPSTKKAVKKEITKEVKKDIIEPIVEEDRETKAKKTVEKLLEGIYLNPNDYKRKPAESVEIDSTDNNESEINQGNGNEWLEQQVTELTQINEYLRLQLANVNTSTQQPNNQYTNNDVILEDQDVKVNVIRLFTEMQTVYINVGFNYTSGTPKSNMIIYPENFMARLLDFFPFLEEYRKIQLH